MINDYPGSIPIKILQTEDRESAGIEKQQARTDPEARLPGKIHEMRALKNFEKIIYAAGVYQ